MNALRKPSVADSGDSTEFFDSLDTQNESNKYDETTQKETSVLEKSIEITQDSLLESTTSEMDTTVVKKKPDPLIQINFNRSM